MGSTEIVNRTTKPLAVKIGNCRYFIKLTTIGKHQIYVVHVDYDDTYMEYSFQGVDSATDTPLIVSSDECVDNERIVIMEVDGKLHAEMEPRVMLMTESPGSCASTDSPSSDFSNVLLIATCEPARKRPCTSWLRLWIF